MKNLLAALISAALIAMPLVVISTPAAAQTVAQVKNDKSGENAKTKSNAKQKAKAKAKAKSKAKKSPAKQKP